MAPPRLLSFIIRHRRASQAIADVIALVSAFLLCAYFLQDYGLPGSQWPSVLALIGTVIVAQLLIGTRLGLYTGRSRYGSFDEIRAVVATVVAATAVLVLAAALLPDAPHERAQVGTGLLALLWMMGIRYVVRATRDHRLRPSVRTAKRVLIFGAGTGGVQIINALLHSPDSPYIPVALLDDDPAKSHLRIEGVPVMGTRDKLASVVRATGAHILVVAIPSASATLIREVVDLAKPLDVDVRVLPPVVELLGDTVQLSDIRPVTYADLLGRREIDIDLASISGYLTGRRVLVTGAGGSIGSELCRQVARFKPAALIMLDRDESALHSLELSLEGRALLSNENLVVADIRDHARMEEIFALTRPNVVFHAAALKHLPLLQLHPSEGVKTNIIGTQNLLDLAISYQVSHFVNISTDKAADPSSVLGYLKRITERLTAAASEVANGAFLSVRFGNVLGSRGSVLPAFREQIAAGGPVTVTDPNVTRYFMTVEEAVRLVVQAGAIGGSGGHVMVLDMGKPIRIADIAQRLIDTSGKAVEIIYTGLRPGEKLHEDLLGDGEVDHRPAHPLISQVPVPPLDSSTIALLDTDAPRNQLISLLAWLALAPPLSNATAAAGRTVPQQRDGRLRRRVAGIRNGAAGPALQGRSR